MLSAGEDDHRKAVQADKEGHEAERLAARAQDQAEHDAEVEAVCRTADEFVVAEVEGDLLPMSLADYREPERA